MKKTKKFIKKIKKLIAQNKSWAVAIIICSFIPVIPVGAIIVILFIVVKRKEIFHRKSH
jgi:uncharacterized membrane protein YdjX (TVP38/TMEM64 family)